MDTTHELLSRSVIILLSKKLYKIKNDKNATRELRIYREKIQ